MILDWIDYQKVVDKDISESLSSLSETEDDRPKKVIRIIVFKRLLGELNSLAKELMSSMRIMVSSIRIKQDQLRYQPPIVMLR
jgi:hypothetical protein